MCVNLTVEYYGTVNRITLPVQNEDEAIREVYEMIDKYGNTFELVSIKNEL